MKSVFCWVLVLLALHAFVFADAPKTIFDDDWVPPASKEAPHPSSQPVNSAANATPSPPQAVPAIPPEPSRTKVPSLAAQANAWRAITEDLYKNDIANAATATRKVELARKLMSVAEDTTDDRVGKYVLLAHAKELAIISGDPPTAFKCLDDLGKDYDIDYPSMKLDLFASLSKSVSMPSDIQEVAEGLNRWADAQVRNDRYDAANRACDIALAVAHKSSDPTLVDLTLQHRKQIAEIRSAFLASKAKLAVLSREPNNAAANLALGQFYCFMKGDWDTGLPMLERGSDAKFRELAKQELATRGSDAKVAIADAWWAMMSSERDLARDRIRDHAVKIYTDVLPNLDGLSKAKVEKRLSVAQSEASGGQSELLPCTLLDPNSNKVVSVALRNSARAQTEERFTPPVEFVLAVRTDSASRNDFRISYAADQIIFNWEGNPDELRIDGGPANGRHLGGAGRTPVNRWVQIVLQVLPDSLNIYVDGKQRYHTAADFSAIDQPFSIWAASRSNVTVGSVVARKPQPRGE